MTDLALDNEAPRRPRANLGTPDEEEIFAAFDTRILRRFFAFLKPHRTLLFLAEAAVLLSSLASISLPLLVGAIVDAAVAGHVARLEQLIEIFAGVVVVSAVASFCDQWSTSRLAQKVIFDVRRSMFAHFQDVALTFLDKTHVGRIMSRLQGDVNALQEFLESSTGALGDFTQLFGYAAVLLWLDWKLGLLTPGDHSGLDRRARGLAALFEEDLPPRPRRLFDRQRRARRKHQRRAHGPGDAPRGDELRTLRSQGQGELRGGREVVLAGPDHDPDGGHPHRDRHGLHHRRRRRPGARWDPRRSGCWWPFILYVQRFFEPVRQLLSMQYTVMQRAMAAGYRIFEVLDVPITIFDKPDAVTLRDVESTIELDHVTFGYAPDRPILHDVSLKVKPRQVIALVGPTGSGKTSITLARPPLL